MIGAGFKLHAGPDLAPRLPVALLSLGFLAFFFMCVRKLWDTRVAGYATAMLATSAGWLAFSHIAVTDLPLAAFFSAAVLLCLPTAETAAPSRDVTLAAAALALAVLAKSLVPLVLFIPVILLNYRSLVNRRSLPALLVFAAIAVPWYWLCTLRNGNELLRVLFVEQQFGRFVGGSLSPATPHVQPWWFYFPAALLLLFPWFPLLPVASRDFRDRRVLTLAAVVLFGFVFFSASRNKLAGYLLPLLPSTCILLGIGLAGCRRPERALILPLALMGVLPVAAHVLPGALAGGLGSTSISIPLLSMWLAGAALAGILLAAFHRVPACFAAIAAAFLWFETAAFPGIDQAASARPLWLKEHPACAPPSRAATIYSLNYYAGRELPPCNPDLDQPAVTVVR
jgi:4-amino-4-deoxy-L-arabinose transferase-like glycosyltransferase